MLAVFRDLCEFVHVQLTVPRSLQTARRTSRRDWLVVLHKSRLAKLLPQTV